MNALKVYPLLLAFAGITWLSCNKENNPAPSEGSPVRVTFAGQITDENGAPLPDAVVTAGTATANTDNNGIFRLEQITLPERNAILTVHLEGYFDFSRAYFVQDGAIQQVNIQLLKKQLSLSFTAGQETEVAAGKARIRFPAHSIATIDGNPYDNTVNVYARYLDPGSLALERQMPGDLRGIDAAGTEQTLATFGMIAVEISTPAGDPLKIASGSEVEVSMPVPAEKMAAAPAEIPLWHFDPDKARWIEEGNAQKTGDLYVGKVKHFTFWNWDLPLPAVNLQGQVFFDNNTQPLPGALVKLSILSEGWAGYAYSNENGGFGGAVPKDEIIQVDIFIQDRCGSQSVYSTTIGPFDSDVVLPAIIVPAANIKPLTVSGRLVNCDSQPVKNGYVLVYGGFDTGVIFAADDGTFEKIIFRCGQNDGLVMLGIDPLAQKQSEKISVSDPVSPLQTGDISVCYTAEEFASFLFNGVTYTFNGAFTNSYDDAFKTSISCPGDGQSFSMLFSGFEKTGAFSLVYLSVYNITGNVFSTHSGTVQITNYGKSGEFISGTVGGTGTTPTGQSFPFSGSFQVIRDF